MTHVKQFRGIPMSKSMRDLCTEEDYAFLGMSEELKETARDAGASEDEKKEEQVRWRLQREQQERERARETQERTKEKEQQWRNHVAELTASQKTRQERLTRLRRFREFQWKVLVEEAGLEGAATVNHILTRM